MPKLIDRVRLKDRIIESISRAVKQIQRLHDDKGEEVVLVNDDWQFHKLVGHLDHALMHGLKHITNGYWVVVQEFTPKATVKEINLLQNVTTHLGRGRAWLYIALMDRLLESYIKCYIDNRGRVSKFYMKDALMLDQHSTDVIHTLAAGLEFITFNLEVDVPFLDLCSHQRLRTSSYEEDCDVNTDRMSLGSSSSTVSLTATEVQEVGVDAVSLQSELDNVNSTHTLHTSNSDPVFQENHAKQHPTRNLIGFTEEPSGELEVIRHKVKVHRVKRKKKKDNDSLSSVDTDRISTCSRTNQDSPVSLSSYPSHESPLGIPPQNQDSPLTPESGYRSVVDNNSLKGKLFEDNNAAAMCTPVAENDILSDKESVDGHQVKDDSVLRGINCNQNDVIVTSKNVFATECSKENLSDKYVNSSSSQISSEQCIQERSNQETSVNSSQVPISDQFTLPALHDNCDNGQNNEINLSVNQNIDVTANQISCQKNSIDLNINSINKQENCMENADVTNQNMKMSNEEPGSMNQSLEGSGELFHRSVEVEPIYETSSSKKKELNNGLSKANGRAKRKSSQKGMKTTDLQRDVNKMKTADLGGNTSLTGCQQTKSMNKSNVMKQHPDWDVEVDNNTKLYLMLEVFQAEEENFIKMFRTCFGHTEGEVIAVHVVITDHALYITTPGASNFRFHKEACVTFKELDYISLSLGYQVINIVCTNRRKQFWITTGDEALTKSIVSHIDNAISHSAYEIPRLSVLTDATIQKIAIKKWAATECPSQKTELKILDYSLVYWEDAESSSSSWLQININKAGPLYYKSHNAYFGLGAPVWKSAYFVLKEGALFMYNNQHDSMNSTPAVSCLQLNHEECQGCRTCRDSDRPHSLEIVLKDSSSLELAADDLTECQEWLQSLCQVVAQGMGVLPKTDGCLACCSTLTSTRILLCHEDVQTNFFRTLAAANVMDISAVQVDKTVNNYCFLKFDSPNHAEHQKWIMYFNSHTGRDHFLSSLDQAWTKLFQVSLAVGDITDLTVQQHCRENVTTIKQQRSI